MVQQGGARWNLENNFFNRNLHSSHSLYFSLTKWSRRRDGIHHSAAARNLICRSISPDSRHKAITQSRTQSPLGLPFYYGSFFEAALCTVSKDVHCSPDIWSNQIYGKYSCGPKWVPMYVYIIKSSGYSVHFCWAIPWTGPYNRTAVYEGENI